MKYLFVAAFSLMLCFAAQHLALRASGGRFTKSESNFFSSLGRIQAGTVGKPEVMLLGSSITGRLPDRAQGFAGFANMGCDGGSALDALRAMDRGNLPVAPLLVVEANTLGRELNGQASEVAAAMEGGWFRVGKNVPAFSAYARPAAYFYSILLARRTGDFGDPASGEDLKVSSLPMPLERNPAGRMTPAEASLKEELVAITLRLKEKGSRVVFAWLPPARGEGMIPDWIHALIAESDSLWWDLGNEADPTLVNLTDATHMSAPSAARTVISLRNGLPKR